MSWFGVAGLWVYGLGSRTPGVLEIRVIGVRGVCYKC